MAASRDTHLDHDAVSTTRRFSTVVSDRLSSRPIFPRFHFLSRKVSQTSCLGAVSTVDTKLRTPHHGPPVTAYSGKGYQNGGIADFWYHNLRGVCSPPSMNGLRWSMAKCEGYGFQSAHVRLYRYLLTLEKLFQSRPFPPQFRAQHHLPHHSALASIFSPQSIRTTTQETHQRINNIIKQSSTWSQ
jgi:hypothetical protein